MALLLPLATSGRVTVALAVVGAVVLMVIVLRTED
jgi:hypothetical protein